MPLVRILVDGYSLLHAWPELARGKARHSAAARDELIHVLTQYRDALRTPITVVFDGAGAPAGITPQHSAPEMEVLYSRDGRSADDLIERAAHRFQAYGEVLAVTDDYAVRDTVIGFGGMAASCDTFIAQVRTELEALQSDLQNHNRRERSRFKARART
ncbi:MAG TPA: NYN domain-containing protein [Verrucomicrobiae bacterium]|jgi:predicted RNA-binding protein with PIN domain